MFECLGYEESQQTAGLTTTRQRPIKSAAVLFSVLPYVFCRSDRAVLFLLHSVHISPPHLCLGPPHILFSILIPAQYGSPRACSAHRKVRYPGWTWQENGLSSPPLLLEPSSGSYFGIQGWPWRWVKGVGFGVQVPQQAFFVFPYLVSPKNVGQGESPLQLYLVVPTTLYFLTIPDCEVRRPNATLWKNTDSLKIPCGATCVPGLGINLAQFTHQIYMCYQPFCWGQSGWPWGGRSRPGRGSGQWQQCGPQSCPFPGLRPPPS